MLLELKKLLAFFRAVISDMLLMSHAIFQRRRRRRRKISARGAH
jgi:hypothetical protein